MEYNNFDQNSKGINVSGTFYYSSDLSQIYFDESIKRLGNESVFFYSNYGNIDDEVSFTIKGLKKDLINYLNNNVGEYQEWKESNKQKLLDDVLNYNDEITLLNYEDIEKNLKEYNIQLIPSTPIDKIITRGYSQGDYAEVFYFPEKLKEVWGVKEINESDLQTEISHIFWDYPIQGKITINGEEYDYEEDTYEWERDKFIESVVKHFGESVREEVESVVPKELQYV